MKNTRSLLRNQFTFEIKVNVCKNIHNVFFLFAAAAFINKFIFNMNILGS